jgi:hypothetical protein
MEGRLSTLFLRLLPAAYMAIISTSYTIQSLLKDDAYKNILKIVYLCLKMLSSLSSVSQTFIFLDFLVQAYWLCTYELSIVI